MIFSSSDTIDSVLVSFSDGSYFAILNKASIILVFISVDALFVNVIATIPLYLAALLGANKIDRYSKTS